MRTLLILHFLSAVSVLASDEDMHSNHQMHQMHEEGHHSMMTELPNPAGLMGNLMNHAGYMFSVKHSYMNMKGNILNGDNISDFDILQMTNPLGRMPKNLSVIPQDMKMQMTMVEGMFAPTKDLTFMLMGTYLSKDMDLNTHSAMMKRDLIGAFSSSTSGLSDITFSTLFKLSESEQSKLFAEIAYQQSVGSKSKSAFVLTPMNKSMQMIMPYGMQLSDKASRLIFGFTNIMDINTSLKWGNQFKRKTVINHEAWYFGDQTEINSWFKLVIRDDVSVSARLKFLHDDAIKGSNALISAPVQTANPNNYGGSQLFLGLGGNYKFTILSSKHHILGFECLLPVSQEKNNLQMKTDYQLVFSYQRHF